MNRAGQPGREGAVLEGARDRPVDASSAGAPPDGSAGAPPDGAAEALPEVAAAAGPGVLVTQGLVVLDGKDDLVALDIRDLAVALDANLAGSPASAPAVPTAAGKLGCSYLLYHSIS